MMMQLGTLIPFGDIGGDPAVLREYAQAAEAVGYDFIEAPDHVLGQNPAGQSAGERIETRVPARPVHCVQHRIADQIDAQIVVVRHRGHYDQLTLYRNRVPIKDTGEQRTWPNFMSREGARGQEYNAWSADGGNPPNHDINLVFTRFLSGPMDFMFVRATHGRVVIAVFALRNEPVWRDECDVSSRERRITTAGKRGTRNASTSLSEDGAGGPKKCLHDDSY